MLNRFKSLLALPARPFTSSPQKQTQRVTSTALSSRDILDNLQQPPLSIRTAAIFTSQPLQPHYKNFSSPKPTFLYQKNQNTSDFIKLKNIFADMIDALSAIQDELKNSPDFEKLYKAISAAQNEQTLVRTLYPLKIVSPLHLKPWNSIRPQLLNHPMFKDSLRFREQCYFIMEDPQKIGLAFHHNADLVNEYAEYLFNARNKTFHYEECYQDTLNELTDGLLEGKYKQTVSKMRREIDVYNKAKQIEENTNTRIQENNRVRMRRWGSLS